MLGVHPCVTNHLVKLSLPDILFMSWCYIRRSQPVTLRQDNVYKLLGPFHTRGDSTVPRAVLGTRAPR